MSDWEDCVVSYFDLIGIRKMIKVRNSEAPNLMRKLHTLTYKSINIDMPFHRHAYAWNDSAMFLAFPKSRGDYETIMRELDHVKPEFDAICPSYAVSVTGQAIPEPACKYGMLPKFVFLKTSGYAFKNCFAVEDQLKSLRMDWYIDCRIVRKISGFPKSDRHYVAMLPTNRKRGVYVLKGKIWKQP